MLFNRSIHPKHENPCEKTHPYLEKSDFSEFSKSAISSSSLFLSFFLEMLTPLEKVSSMRNATEKCVWEKI